MSQKTTRRLLGIVAAAALAAGAPVAGAVPIVYQAAGTLAAVFAGNDPAQLDGARFVIALTGDSDLPPTGFNGSPRFAAYDGLSGTVSITGRPGGAPDLDLSSSGFGLDIFNRSSRDDFAIDSRAFFVPSLGGGLEVGFVSATFSAPQLYPGDGTPALVPFAFTDATSFSLDFWESAGATYRTTLTSFAGTAQSVAEPGAAGGLLLGLAAVGLRRRRVRAGR